MDQPDWLWQLVDLAGRTYILVTKANENTLSRVIGE